MRACVLWACAALGLVLDGEVARGGGKGDPQPWWGRYANSAKEPTAKEQRLQKFWHDYSEALKRYYQQPDQIDWVAHYKNAPRPALR